MPSNAPPKTSANVTSATVSAVIANYPLAPLAGWPPALPGRPSHVAPWAVTTIRKLRRLRYVRFGSLADICSAQAHVRFTPESDIDCVLGHVCFGPIADISLFIRLLRRRERVTKVAHSDQVPSQWAD